MLLTEDNELHENEINNDTELTTLWNKKVRKLEYFEIK